MRNWAKDLFIISLLIGISSLGFVVGCGQQETGTTTTIPLLSISGTVEGFNAGIPGVLVTLESSTQTATTDANGEFTFTGIDSGTHTLSFYKNGWTITPPITTFEVTADLTRNATAELTNFELDSSGTTQDLYDIYYHPTLNEGSTGGNNSTFLWNASSWSQPAATGLPTGKKIACVLYGGAASSAIVVFEDGPLYQTADSGGSFSLLANLRTGDASLLVKDIGPTGQTSCYVMDNSDGNLQYSADVGATYAGNADPPSGFSNFNNFNAVEVASEPKDSADYNNDGDQTDIITWIVGENGVIYYADDSNTTGTRNWAQITSPTTDSFTGICLYDISGSVPSGYLVTANGGLYSMSGDLAPGAGSITITEVFNGTPYHFNSVAGSAGSQSYIVGNNGVILKSK